VGDSARNGSQAVGPGRIEVRNRAAWREQAEGGSGEEAKETGRRQPNSETKEKWSSRDKHFVLSSLPSLSRLSNEEGLDEDLMKKKT